MSDECRVCLLGLIFLSSLLTGSSGVDETHVFISSGENVHLPCNNALHDCSLTVWNYNRFRDSATVELIALGIKKKDTESHERLSLGSDCSLNIRNISTEDYGFYRCQQWTGVNKDQQQGTDARVFLHVLHVSSSQTEISAGLSVTLSCQLYSYPRVSCDDSVGSERIQLFWVNQAGVKLTRSDSRYQISSSSDHCIITLTTTLLNEDDNREWRCEVTQRDQVKTSVTYTVKSSAQSDSTTSVIPVHSTHSQDPSTTNTHATKGISGVNDAHVFISSGENVRLSCNNALHDCTSTTWIYNRFRYSAAVELIALGIKKDTERHERLSLGSDCSLNIRNISTEDYGLYICRQWTGVNRDKKHGRDARVYLHVLHVSSSQTEISAGLSVTLFCQLYSYTGGSCDDSVGSERIQLFWVNQTGVKLTRSDSRYQISSSSDHCIITLNTTLLNEDDNREWRCEVTQRDQVQTSVTYTVKSSAQADSTTVIPVTDSPTTAAITTEEIVIVIAVCASFALLLLALILWMMIRKKRSGVRRATDDSVDPSSRGGTNSLFCESQVNLESLHSSPESRQTSPSQVEQTDDVTYTEVTAFSKNRAKKNKVRCDDKVTYASIGGAKAGAQEDCSQLYASVTKNHHKSGK